MARLRDVCRDSTSGRAVQQRQNLTSAITRLVGTEFDTPTKRISNKMAYYQALKNVILATSDGPELIECFETPDDSRFEQNYNFTVTQKPLNGITATFDYERQPNGKYRNEIEISATEKPAAALTFFAHELKHSCNAPEVLSYELSGNDIASDQSRLVDEIRAYNFHAEFFLEVASQNPTLFCEKTPMQSGMFKPESTLQDLLIDISREISSGTFYRRIISLYMNNIFLLAENFYEVTSTTETTDCPDDEDTDCTETTSTRNSVSDRPRKDLIEKFQTAGFRIVP